MSFLSVSVMLYSGIPFIGFGFLDNLIMIVAVSVFKVTFNLFGMNGKKMVKIYKPKC